MKQQQAQIMQNSQGWLEMEAKRNSLYNIDMNFQKIKFSSLLNLINLTM